MTRRSAAVAPVEEGNCQAKMLDEPALPLLLLRTLVSMQRFHNVGRDTRTAAHSAAWSWLKSCTTSGWVRASFARLVEESPRNLLEAVALLIHQAIEGVGSGRGR